MNRIFYMAMLLVTWLSFAPSYADDVAQIGSTTYSSLAEAIADVPANGTSTTITMLADHVLASGVTVAKNQSIVIDLAGHTVSGTVATKTDHAYLFTNKGTLEITDSSQGGTGRITYVNTTPDTGYSKETCTIYNAGNLTLTEGTVANTTLGGASYAVTTSSNAWGVGDDKETVFNMNGGTLTCPNGDQALRVYQNSADTTTPFSHNTVTISGGRILDTGIFLDNYIYQPKVNTTGEGISTNVTISGGEIHGLIDMKLRHTFHTSLAITGGTFVDSKFRVRKAAGEWASETPEPTSPVFTISGGQFSFASGNEDKFSLKTGSGTSWTSYEQPYLVSGGVFSLELPTDGRIAYPAGKEVVANTDANTMEAYPWTVGSAAVAQIGSETYASLAEAVAAAQSGDVIELIDNDFESLTSGQEIEITKSITITGATDDDGTPLYVISGTGDNSGFNDLFVNCTTGTVTISNVGFDGFGNDIESKMGHAPVFIGTNNKKVVLDNVYISNINCEGIHINGGEFEISNCYIDCAKETDESDFTKGICVVNDATGSITNTTIEGVVCEMTNSISAGIELQGQGPITIDGCEITAAGDKAAGIAANSAEDLQPGASTATVSGCTVTSDYLAIYGDGEHGALISVNSGTYNGAIHAVAGEASQGLSVYGGTFSVDPSTCVAAGYEAVDNGDGTFTVQRAAVAQIGSTTYATLAEAIADVPTNGTQTTITMLADETLEKEGKLTVSAGMNIVLDLNGKTVSGSSDANAFYFFTNNGTLEITDNSQDAEGKISFQSSKTDYANERVTIYNLGGTLTLTKGLVENTTAGGMAYAVVNSSNAWANDVISTFNVAGGRVSAPKGDAALRVYQNTSANAVQSKNYVNISGGTIDAAGIFVDTYLYTKDKDLTNYTGSNVDTKINVTGGTVNGLIDMKIRHPFNTLLNISGGDFSNTRIWVRKYASEYAETFGEPTAPMVTISNGTFDFKGNNSFGLAYDYAATSWTSYAKPYEISGGVYDLSVPAEYCADGYAPADNGDGTFTVQKAAVAQIGDNIYASLAEAIAAVPTDGTQTTITMLADEAIAAGLTVAANQNIVLELAGHVVSEALSQSGTTALITNKGTLVIQDNTDTNKDGTGTGKISYQNATPDQSSVPGYASNTIINHGNLTIESGYVENTTSGGYAAYTVDNVTNGNLYTPVFTMNGGKLYNSYTDAVRMFLNSTTNLNKVVINGGVLNSDKASGRVIVMHMPNVYLGKGELNITGGTINGKVNAWSAANDGGVEDRFSDAQYENVSINITGGNIKEISFTEMANTELRANSLIVTGGTYKVSPAVYVTSGYEAVDNGDGTFTVQKASVAQIGETKYASLAEAIAAVPTDGTQTTITMIADEVINVSGSALTIANNMNVVLELNGHQVVGSCSSGSSSALITNRGTLTIQDNTDTNCDGTGTGKMISGADPIWIHDGSDNYSGSYASNLVTNQGTLVIKSGYFENVSHGSATYAVDNQTSNKDVVLNVEGGKLTAVSCVVRMFCNSTTKQNVVNVSGGHIVTSGSTGIWTQLPQSSSSIKPLATLNVTGGEISGRNRAWYDYSFGASFKSVNYSISGGEFNGELLCNAYKNGIIGGFITGGTFSVDPSEYVAAGYAAALVEAENVWKVGPVTVTDLTPQEGATETAAEYKATTVVTDEDDVQHEVGTNQTVFVAVVEENNVGEDVKLSDFKMDEVVTKAVVAANTEDDIDVQLIVKAAEPVVSDETVTFEVHPEAIITVNNGTPTNVELTNDDLAPNATFTFVLDVTGHFSNGATIKVVHKSEGYEDETFYSTVIDGKVTVSGITHFSDFELSVVGAVAQIGETEYASLADAFAAVADGQTITMLIDVTLSEPLNVELAGKAVTLDLGANTLTGRTNLKSGSLTLTNGFVEGGNKQALNVYGSSDPTATNYCVLTIDSNVKVTADVYGVCMFGATASTNGYGAVVNINGRVLTGGDGKNGAVFVSGNLGKNISGDMHNVVNITGEVTSSTDAGVALNGNATVNVLEGAEIMGATGIAVKRGTLNMTGGIIYADGEENTTPSVNNNGTEMTGAGISMSPTYSQYGPMSVVITGGEVQSFNAVALFKQAGTYQSDATFSVSGGLFSSEVPAEFCADGYQPKYDQASGKYTVATFAAIWADKDIVLIDGQSYEACVGQTLTQDVVVNSVTYQRNVPNANTYCAWYVPADYRLTSDDLDQFDFYRINLIANAEGGNEVENTTRIWVYLFPMAADDVLTANRPYVFKTKGGTGEFIFTLENTLHAPATDVRLNNSTTAHNYDFYGTYETTELSDKSSEHFFYVDYYGQMGWPGSYNINVGPYRWYIKTTQKGGGAYYAPTFVFTDDPNVTGITDNLEVKTIDCYYDLKGMKIEKPSKGAYLVKFKDGTVKKVVK
ncbi:MAG: right-handed parallel beta-helix repeat-containing protein [Alloprevotella sp.]|nr:right-handed parallel beta-helix repeat-containing protein [Alloprevotella sp.]